MHFLNPLFTRLLVFILSILAGSVSSFTWCTSASQCIGQSIVDSSSTVYARGYKSIFGPTTSISSTNSMIQCEAAVSCSKLSFLSISTGGDIHCTGSLSCYDITSVQHTYTISPGTSGYIYCYGSNSCQSISFIGSSISSSYPIVKCSGSYSCADSQFTEAKEIIGSGAYSLYNTIIYSTAASNIKVYLQGYHSAFGAKIYCQTGHQCYIYCYNNGCEMLYIECQDVDNCHIITNSVQRTVSPIYNISHFNASKLNVFLSSSITTQNDATCSDADDQSFIYDNMNEINPNDVQIKPPGDYTGDPKNPVCCRGDSACDGSIFIGASLYGHNTIICSGDSSCNNIDSIWSVGGTVSCSGASACWRSPITSDIVTCTGSHSCSAATINARNIYCYGLSSCSSTTIATDINYATLNLYFLGELSGSYASITCASNEVCHIVCGGFNSCSGLTVNCAGICTFQCNIDTECPPGSGITYDPTLAPTGNPTIETTEPTAHPSNSPTISPSSSPTLPPTIAPSLSPSSTPTLAPTSPPTLAPSLQPSSAPSLAPSILPTNAPSSAPTQTPFIMSNSSSLHRKLYQHAVAYWNSNVTLLGGESTVLSVPHQMQQYDAVNHRINDYGNYFIPNGYGVSGMDQYYTQISKYLYILVAVNSDSSSIYRYDLDTNTMETTAWINMETATNEYACITSDKVSNSLIIIGGYELSQYEAGMKVTLDTVQILDVSATLWMSNVPSLNQVRSLLTCNVHLPSKRVYAIGGLVHPTVDDINGGNTDLTYLNTIEYLDISDIYNMDQKSWQNNPYTLPFAAASGVRSVVYVHNIYVIGGISDDTTYVQQMQIIDTSSGIISFGAVFNPSTGLRASACVVIDGVIYAFGGRAGDPADEYVLDSWQYYDTCISTMDPSISPTNNPSTTPTKQPTLTPITSNPSVIPTKAPSVNPTNSPVHEPSLHPSISPSDHPTKDPSGAPTRYPSVDPSKTPSRVPTKLRTSDPSTTPSYDPTHSPSNDPTFSPSKNPTNAPSNNASLSPSSNPSISPSKNPTFSPSKNPTFSPSKNPTNTPSNNPSLSPSKDPTFSPSKNPTFSPSNNPTNSPLSNINPTFSPSYNPTHSPSNNPTYSPSNDPTQSPTLNPSVFPTIQPTFNPTINNDAAKTTTTARISKLLYFVCYYEDNKEFLINYFSLSDYGQIMTESIISSTQSVTLQPFYYEDSVQSALAEWRRAGILYFSVCSVFNVELMNINSNCVSDNDGLSGSDDDSFISISVFSITADDALEQYDNWLIDIFESSHFEDVFNSNMNNKLNEHMANRRRLSQYDGFQVTRINIIDPLQYTTEPTSDNEDKSQNATKKKQGSTAITAVFVCVLIVFIILAVVVNIYAKKKKEEEMIGRKMEMQQTDHNIAEEDDSDHDEKETVEAET